jgi:hypothetical protein
MPAESRSTKRIMPTAEPVKRKSHRLERAVQEAIWKARLHRAEVVWQRLLARLKS